MAAPVDQDARMYCSVSDVTTRIELETMPSVNLDFLIQAVTARIERYCDRVFTRVPASDGEYEERRFLAAGNTVLEIDDLLELESVTVDGSTEDTDDIFCMPFGQFPTTWLEYEGGDTWPAGDEVVISGVWGYSETVPWPIWDAAVALAVRALERAKTAYQDASAIPEMGEMVYARAFPPDVRDTLNRYRRPSL